jgi:hypothetical protein
MSADLWGAVNTIIVPNRDDCISNVGDGSDGVKGEGGDDNSAMPPPPPPPLVLLVVVVVIDDTSLLPTVAPIDDGIHSL